MDDFVAYPAPLRIAFLILIGLGFVVGGLWIVGFFGEPPPSSRYSPEFSLIIGWTCVAFFGFATATAVRKFFDRREQLRIGSAGIRSAQWSDETIPWSEIVDVTTWTYKGQKAIILRLRDRTRYPGRGLAGALAGLSRGLTGGDVSISLTGTDRRVDDALSAIAQFRSSSARFNLRA